MTLTLVTLALTASPAVATSYSAPTFSGGYWTFDDDPNSYPFPQANPYAGRHEDANFCGGDLTATSTWTPDNSTDTSPAPQVIVTQVVSAGWGVLGAPSEPTHSCKDGFGDLEVPSSASPSGGNYGGSSGRTNYSVQSPSGSTVTVTCSGVSATLDYNSTTPPVDDGGVGASWGVTFSPVTLNLGGAVQDSNGNYNILVGQSCTASLSGIPAALLNNTANPPTYQWSVSGTTFQSWTVSSDKTTTTEVDGPGVLTNSTAQWFWNDNLGSGNSKQETVTCTVMVTPPAGQGAAFSVTASQPVTVWVPKWSESGTGDGMYVVNRTPTSSPDFWVEAGPTPGGNDEGGMNWMGSVHSPLPATFSDGTLTMTQLVIPGNSIVAQGMHYHVSNNGQEGLDTSYPYPNENTGNIFASHDSPGIDLTNTVAGCAAYSAVTQDQFEDYVLFTPPGSSQCVPLGHFVWSTNGNVTEPYQNNIYDWAYFGSGSAGSMNPSGTRSFVQLNSFPSWTQNSGNSSYYWVGG